MNKIKLTNFSLNLVNHTKEFKSKLKKENYTKKTMLINESILILMKQHLLSNSLFLSLQVDVFLQLFAKRIESKVVGYHQ